MYDIIQAAKNAATASKALALLAQEKKSEALIQTANSLIEKTSDIITANIKDIENAKASGMSEALIDRLMLNKSRIEAMAEGLRQIATLSDPVGDVIQMTTRPNGLIIGKRRVPLGVVGIIYESRPNVTADAFGLCFKTGNACILRGGSDAINSNIAISSVIKNALLAVNISPEVIQFVEDPSREIASQMMKLNDYIDVLIPRGGAGLIENVVKNSTVPVIETGTGNCHVYVDSFANIDMACNIIVNAKTQRLGTCNTCESLVIHSEIAKKALPLICKKLYDKNIEIRGDEKSIQIVDSIIPATESDWGQEYLDAIISIKIVDSIDDAISHINTYNTGHSDAIVSDNYANCMKFHNEIDSAAVYVNASTRFTDGFEFGFGAEIGISTQKIHARGPMGLEALTTYKYIIFGNGQVRP